jgi:hypothetical protein
MRLHADDASERCDSGRADRVTRGSGDDLHELRERYLHFAENEAAGVSPLYEALARGVATSDPVLRWIATLPGEKRQPNLVFAAVRHVHGTPSGFADLAAALAGDDGRIRALILSRATQTNEPGRCATLLPVLARLPQPLALIEVGAAAGLCLLPDLYGYDYGRARIEPAVPGAPVFPCDADAATPLPDRHPSIAWRAGIDLRPVEPADPEQSDWLRTLVWPGQESRADRLRAALRLAATHRPRVVRGDLTRDLPTLAAHAPRDATLVVFHSAVLAYVAPEARDAFARTVRELGAVWISNESAGVLPAVAARLDRDPPKGRFLLSVDGEPVAFTGPHGQSIEWIGRSDGGTSANPPA